MTIAIAWTRKVLNYEQLLFVSDSRISGGATFDACPKILTLPRADCAVAFAGYEGHAFPMMLQLGLAIDAFPKMRRGAHEISRVRTHALRIFDGMSKLIDTTISSQREILTKPDATFIFGGYSWRLKRFQVWTLKYGEADKKFGAHPAPSLCFFPDLNRVGWGRSIAPGATGLGLVAIAGDQSREARKRLFELVARRIGKQTRKNLALNMEPFEVVRDMLRDRDRSPSIGGAPQLVKVFQYLRSASFAVYWPDKESGVPHLHGRPVLPYEAWDKHVIDPDTLKETAIPNRSESDHPDFETEPDASEAPLGTDVP
jgi:hypothetical protein